ncbi:hypothetical protein C0995_010679 [Termitomyces sp. Mi166|nr:hypothetical protein C0995_010679 [Termitomyces sp. Mi166\
MVFAKLQNDEKEAFFSLLDEYFASRPDVFGKLAATSSHDSGGVASAAAPAAQHAFASLGGLKRGATRSTSSYSPPEPEQDQEASNSVAGRIAAFSGRNSNDNAPPQRIAPPIAQKPAGATGLVSSQRLGSLNTSSKGAMIGSLYPGNKSKNPSPAAPPPPPAFPPKKNTFGPPPTRQLSSESPPLPRRQPEPEPEPEPEEETHGEWALALYDYNSQEPGDLQIKENEHVLVTERTSDDWYRPTPILCYDVD